MERENLINEIIDFCLDYRLFSEGVIVGDMKIIIEKELEDFEFVESLINTIIVKSKTRKKTDSKRLRSLLLELEKIRLEMEYK